MMYEYVRCNVRLYLYGFNPRLAKFLKFLEPAEEVLHRGEVSHHYQALSASGAGRF